MSIFDELRERLKESSCMEEDCFGDTYNIVDLDDVLLAVDELEAKYGDTIIETIKSDRLECEVPSDCFDTITEIHVIDETTEETRVFKEEWSWK